MKTITIIIVSLFLFVSCAVAPVPARADESATKALEAKNLSLELYILGNSIKEKVAEINKLQADFNAKKKKLDELIGVKDGKEKVKTKAKR